MGVCGCLALLCAASPCLADTLVLTTGETLVGKVVSEDAASVVFESAGLGKVSVPRDRVQRIEKGPVAGATPSGAQEVVAPPVPLGEPVAQAAPPPPPPQKEDLFRMYWDQGLRYQLYQPISVPNPLGGERIIGEEIRLSGRAGLKLSLDAADFHSTNREEQIPGGAEVRTFRLYANGQFGRGPDPTLYSLEFGTVNGSFYMTNGWLRWQGVQYAGNVQAGYETVPQTLENIYAFNALTFMEASSMSLAFSPGKRLGVEADRTFSDERMYLSVGVYSVGSDPGLNGGSVAQTLLYPVVRFTGLPIYDDRGTDDVKLLHLGISVGYQLAKGAQFEFRSRPESFIAPYLVNTGTLQADVSSLVGLESIYMNGRFTLTGELTGTRLMGGTVNDASFWGGYVSAGWFLTGEQRRYNRDSAQVIAPLVPNREFSWKDWTGGAWEVAARLSYVDLDSENVLGGKMAIAMLGLNWYWNRYLRWQLNTGYANVIDGPSPGNLYILQARLQMVF